MNNNFFQALGYQINLFLREATSSSVVDKIDLFGVVIGSAIIVSILYQAVEIIMGRNQAPVNNLIWDMSKKFAICSICIGGSTYVLMITDALKEIHDWFGGGSGGLYGDIDRLVDMAMKISSSILKEHNWFGGVYAILFWVGFLMALLPAFLTVLTTSLTVSILILVFPLALMSLMYKQTSQIFVQWLNMFIANTLTVFFISIFMGVVIKILNNWMPAIKNGETVMIIFYMFVLGATMGQFLSLAKSLAQSLAQISFDTATSAMGMGVMRSAGMASGGIAYGAYRYGKFLATGGISQNTMTARAGQAIGKGIAKRFYKK